MSSCGYLFEGHARKSGGIMVAATPETLGTVVGQILTAASELTDEGTQELTDIMDHALQEVGQVVDKITLLPEDLLQRLKDFAKDPDWNTLLVFVFLEIQKLDDEHLRVGTMQAPGFVRGITLTYTETGDISGNPSIGVSAGRKADPLKKGLHLRLPAGVALNLGDTQTLSLSINSEVAADWDWEFGAAPTTPGADGQVSVRISWRLPVPAVDTAGVTFRLGPAIVQATLQKAGADVTYAVDIGLGNRAVATDHGLTASLSVESLLGDLKGLAAVELPKVDYSPHLALSTGSPPEFSLA